MVRPSSKHFMNAKISKIGNSRQFQQQGVRVLNIVKYLAHSRSHSSAGMDLPPFRRLWLCCRSGTRWLRLCCRSGTGWLRLCRRSGTGWLLLCCRSGTGWLRLWLHKSYEYININVKCSAPFVQLFIQHISIHCSFKAVLRIRIQRIHIILPDPDP